MVVVNLHFIGALKLSGLLQHHMMMLCRIYDIDLSG